MNRGLGRRRGRWRQGLLRLLVAALAFAPALAGPVRLELLASAAQVATGNGGGIEVRSLEELIVYVDVTVVSGTTPLLDVWLQSSSDGGTTWYDLPYRVSLVDAPASAIPGALSGASRDILSGASATIRAVSQYDTFGDSVRVRWVISGTTPSFTFSVRAIGK